MLEIDKNPISFIDVYLRQSIQFLHKKNFKYSFIVSSVDKPTESLEKEFLTTEIDQTRVLSNSIIKKTISQFIERNIARTISKDEYEIYASNFNRNVAHLLILFPILSKKLSISPAYFMNLKKKPTNRQYPKKEIRKGTLQKQKAMECYLK